MKMKKYPNVKNEINPTQSQHDVSPVYGFFKCQEKYVNSYLVTTFYTEVMGN